MFVCLGLAFVCFFCDSLDDFIPVLLAFAVLALVSSVPTTKPRDWLGRS